jgi:hypothetical protein
MTSSPTKPLMTRRGLQHFLLTVRRASRWARNVARTADAGIVLAWLVWLVVVWSFFPAVWVLQ